MAASVGANLDSLAVHGQAYLNAEEIDSIRENCRGLKRIHISAIISSSKTAVVPLTPPTDLN